MHAGRAIKHQQAFGIAINAPINPKRELDHIMEVVHSRNYSGPVFTFPNLLAHADIAVLRFDRPA